MYFTSRTVNVRNQKDEYIEELYSAGIRALWDGGPCSLLPSSSGPPVSISMRDRDNKSLGDDGVSLPNDMTYHLTC
jgi:hypothetical protein